MKTLIDYFDEWLDGGIFKYIAELKADDTTWAWLHSNIVSLSTDYYGNHSGSKPISSLLDKLLTDDELTEESKRKIASVIVNRFGNNWTKLAKIYGFEYNPIHNYEMDYVETPDIEVIRTPNITDTYTPDVKREITSENANTETPDITVKETPNITVETETEGKDSVYGFNSVIAAPADETKGGTKEIETGSRDRHETGTRTIEGNETRTETETGTKTTTKTGTETETTRGTKRINRTGNIGVTTTQQMIQQEIDIWKWNFVERIFEDLDEILTLPIYL